MRRPSALACLAALVAIVAFGCNATSPSPATGPASASPAPTPSSATPSASSVASASPSSSPTPSLSASPEAPANIAPLDGVRTDPARAGRLPLAIMIDDAVAARPQAGFNAASIVYQAPADGGEDRYMFVFQEGDAKVVGPVRSGRPYFVRWAAEFRAAFGHYGGDLKTLQKVIPPMDGDLIFDVDALRNASSAYHRDKNRPKPHNAYTSTSVFRRVAEKVGSPKAMVGGLAGWAYIEDRPAGDRPATGSITIPYGTGTVGYEYDRKANAYRRSVAGKAQVDAGDKRRVVARNVVVLFMKLSWDPDSEPGHRRPVLDQIGSGKAIVFRDGAVINGTWRKDDVAGLTRFFDSSNSEIALVRGHVFIQVVPTGTKVKSTFR